MAVNPATIRLNHLIDQRNAHCERRDWHDVLGDLYDAKATQLDAEIAALETAIRESQQQTSKGGHVVVPPSPTSIC